MKQLLLFLAAILTTCCNPALKPTIDDLFEADRNFSKMAMEKGFPTAFIEYAHPDAVLLRPKSMPITGKPAIKNLYEKADSKGVDFTWEPLAGELAVSGELGFTYGIYTVKKDTALQQGTYVSVWKKDRDGNWKYILDTGNEGLGVRLN